MRRTTRSSQSGRVVKKPQECRAHLKGRCTMGEGCYETHETPESTITCCATTNFTQCRALVGKCPYKRHTEGSAE